jgi:hypothetical protein
VILDVDESVEITGTSPTNSSIAVTGRTQSNAGVDACWDAEFDASFTLDATLSSAIATWIGDDFASTSTFGTSRLLDENSGLPADNPAPPAGAASFYPA